MRNSYPLISMLIFVLLMTLLVATVNAQVAPTVSSTGNESTVVKVYRYVFPLPFAEPMWKAHDFWIGAVITSASETVNVWIDANYNNKIDENDIRSTVQPGQVLRIGKGQLMSSNIQWDKNPLIIFTDKPVDIYAWIYNNDFGIYDETGAVYSTPMPATLLLGVNVIKLYITPWEEDANVYINGVYQGLVKYGKVLTVQYDRPTNVIVSSDKPVVAVSLAMDLASKSRLYAYSLMPPLSGEYLIPPAIGSVAKELGATTAEEYYVVVSANGNVLEKAPLPPQPRVLTLNNAAVFVFRIFSHVDPWAHAPRYVASAEGLAPVSPSLCYWVLPAHNAHGEYGQIVVYAKGETQIYFDRGADGSIDDNITIYNGTYILTSRDYPSTLAVYVKGLMTCSATYIGAWNFHLDTATERRSTTLVLSKITTTTATFPAVVQRWGESCVEAVLRALNATGLSISQAIDVHDVARVVARGLPVVADFRPTLGEGHRVVIVGVQGDKFVVWDPSGALLDYSLGSARVSAYVEPLLAPYLYLLDKRVLDLFPGHVVFYETAGRIRSVALLAKTGALYDRFVDPNATFWVWSTGGVDVEIMQKVGDGELRYRPTLVSTQRVNGGFLYEFKWEVEPLAGTTVDVYVNGSRYGPFIVFPSPKVYETTAGKVYISGRYVFAYLPHAREVEISVGQLRFVLEQSVHDLSELVKLPEVGEVKIGGVSTAGYLGRIDRVIYDIPSGLVYVYATADAVLVNGRSATFKGDVWVGRASGNVEVVTRVGDYEVDRLMIEPGVVDVVFSRQVASRAISQIAYVNYTGHCRVKVEGRGDVVVSKATSTLYSSSYVYGYVRRDSGRADVALELTEECPRYSVRYLYRGLVPVARAEAPIAVVLVLDKSGSMDSVDRGVRRIDAAKSAAQVLIDEVAKLGGYVGLIAFDNKPYVLTTLTKNYTYVKSLLRSITPGGSTNIGDSIIEAAKLLENFGGRALIVLVTDGEHNTGTPPEEAVYKIPKIPVFAIGLGNEVSHDQLKLVAKVTGGYYLYSPTATDLVNVFATLVGVALGTLIYNGTSTRLALDLSLYDDVEIVLNWTGRPNVAIWLPRQTVGQVGIVQAEKVPLSQLCREGASCSENGAVIKATNLLWIGIESNAPISVRAASSTPSTRLVKVWPGEEVSPGSVIELFVESPYIIREVRSGDLQCQRINIMRYRCEIPTRNPKPVYTIYVRVAKYIQLGIPTQAEVKDESITIRVRQEEACKIQINGPSVIELNGPSREVSYQVTGQPRGANVNVFIDPYDSGIYWNPISTTVGGGFFVTFYHLGVRIREYIITAGCVERGGADQLTVRVHETFQPSLPTVDEIKETVTVGKKKNITIPLSGKGEVKIVKRPKWAGVRLEGGELAVTLELDKPGRYEGEIVVESAGFRRAVKLNVEALPIASVKNASTQKARAKLSLDGVYIDREGETGHTALAIVDESAVGHKLPSAVKYFDIYSERARRVVVKVNASKAGLALYWYNGTVWKMVARSDTNIIVYEINGTSTPNVGQLSGALFAVAPPVLKGDLNANGVLDIGDVVLLLQIVAERKYDYAADIDNDGEVDIDDIVWLLEQIAKD